MTRSVLVVIFVVVEGGDWETYFEMKGTLLWKRLRSKVRGCTRARGLCIDGGIDSHGSWLN